jgi:uncharacterized protein
LLRTKGSPPRNLGVMYLMHAEGQSVPLPQDYTEALKWFRKAADQGDASGQFNLGNMYDKGEGLAGNNAEAVKWYRLAADQGYAAAIASLRIRATPSRSPISG